MRAGKRICLSALVLSYFNTMFVCLLFDFKNHPQESIKLYYGKGKKRSSTGSMF